MFERFRIMVLQLLRMDAERELAETRPSEVLDTLDDFREYEADLRSIMARDLWQLRKDALRELRRAPYSWALAREKACDKHVALAKRMAVEVPLTCNCRTPYQKWLRRKLQQVRTKRNKWLRVYLWLAVRDTVRVSTWEEWTSSIPDPQQGARSEQRYVRLLKTKLDADGIEYTVAEDAVATDFPKVGDLDYQGFDRPAPRAKRVKKEGAEPRTPREDTKTAIYIARRTRKAHHQSVVDTTLFYRYKGGWYWAKDHIRCHCELENALHQAYRKRVK